MNRRIFALALASVLSLSLLTACGGDKTPASSSADASASQSSASSSEELPEELPALALNKTELTMEAPDATYQLKADVTGTEEEVVWTSSDENVVVVFEDGTITAVAPGTATITATVGELSAQCVITCDWATEEEPTTDEPTADEPSTEEQEPSTEEPTTEEPTTEEPSTEEQEPSTEPSTSSVDLAAFYETVITSVSEENRPFMMELDAETAEMIYPGMGAIATNQKVLYMPGMSAVACEISMVECANAADVETVKTIFQTRINTQIEGGAWYPETIEGWKNNSKIVVKDNFVCLFVIPEGMMDAASEFEKLF